MISFIVSSTTKFYCPSKKARQKLICSNSKTISVQCLTLFHHNHCLQNNHACRSKIDHHDHLSGLLRYLLSLCYCKRRLWLSIFLNTMFLVGVFDKIIVQPHKQLLWFWIRLLVTCCLLYHLRLLLRSDKLLHCLLFHLFCLLPPSCFPCHTPCRILLQLFKKQTTHAQFSILLTYQFKIHLVDTLVHQTAVRRKKM